VLSVELYLEIERNKEYVLLADSMSIEAESDNGGDAEKEPLLEN